MSKTQIAPVESLDEYVKLHTGFTHAELTDAFDLVKNKAHWKNEINSVCSIEQLQVVAVAIEFFTGTRASFQFHQGGSVSVTADGYRKGPCGDH